MVRSYELFMKPKDGSIQGFFPHLSPWELLAVLFLCLSPTLLLGGCFSSLELASCLAHPQLGPDCLCDTL